MGWKASAIFIKPGGEIDEQRLLNLFGSWEPASNIAPEYIDSVINPNKDCLYIARFQDALVICVQDFPERFYARGLSYIETRLTELFPQSEILAVSLDSGTNYYGYALIQQGRKIRVKMGHSGKPVEFEMGLPLPEERALYESSKTDNAGARYFYFERNPEDAYPEDAVGENFVFNLTARFIGEAMDRNDAFFETEAKGFRLAKEDADEKEAGNLPASNISHLANWIGKYKYAITIGLVLLFYIIRC